MNHCFQMHASLAFAKTYLANFSFDTAFSFNCFYKSLYLTIWITFSTKRYTQIKSFKIQKVTKNFPFRCPVRSLPRSGEISLPTATLRMPQAPVTDDANGTKAGASRQFRREEGSLKDLPFSSFAVKKRQCMFYLV